MQAIVPKTTEIRQPNKSSVYTEFILWTAMPALEKRNLGIETLQSFGEYYKVHPDTLTDWKRRQDFEKRVDAILKMWATDKTPDVVHAIYRTAVKGNPLSQSLWLQYFKGFNPRKPDDETKKVEVGLGDIRFTIDQLPEQLKEKHYGYLRELAEDISAFRNARDAEGDNWSARPPETVPSETDNDASDVSSTGENAMAKSHKECVCENLEREILAHHNQSTARGW